MYEQILGLNRRPFSATPDPHVLYESPSVRLALTKLEQTLRLGEGVGMLTAPAGTGKTLVCKVLAERLANDPLPVLLLNSSYPTRSSLLQAILFELDQKYTRMTEQELRLELVAYGRNLGSSQTGIALIVDEAHLLSEHILEELRALTNFMLDSRPIFRVVLCGQLPLEDILTQRSMAAVNQRLKCHLTLEKLSRQQSLEYILTRISLAGGELLEIFSEPALEMIVHASDGLPRCINQLCDHACLLTTVAGGSQVQVSHVQEALRDLEKLPLHWNTSLRTPDPLTELRGPAASAQFTDEQTELSEQPEQQADGVATSFEWGPTAQATDPMPPVPNADDSSTGQLVAPTVPELTVESEPSDSETTTSQQANVFEIGEDVPETINPEPAPQTDQFDPWEFGPETFAEPELSEPTENNELKDSRDAESDIAPAPQTLREPTAIELESIEDHYARLDAVRRGQLISTEHESQPASATSFESTDSSDAPNRQQGTARFSDEIECEIAQTVVDIANEISTALHEQTDETLPSPNQRLSQAADSQSARHDVVDPAPEDNDYNSLYSDLDPEEPI